MSVEVNPLKDKIEAARVTAENDILRALQTFHDTTGLIPVNLTFESINVTAIGAVPAKEIAVSSVHLTANT